MRSPPQLQIIDFEAAVIDGAHSAACAAPRCSSEVDAGARGARRRGHRACRSSRAGTIGPIARALGGASLPLFDRYLIDQYALMRAA